MSIQAEKENNSLIVNAPPSTLQNILAVVKKLDIRPKQVQIQAIIAQVDESEMNQLGVEWGVSNAPSGSGGDSDDASGGDVQTSGSWMPGMGFIPHGKIRAVVHALGQNNASDILSTPSIVVLNNNKAKISDGQTISVQNRTYAMPGDNGGGDTPTPGAGGDNSYTPYNTTDRQNIALTLNVTPQISPNQTVRLNIKQDDNSLAASYTPGDLNPEENTSNITTNVLVNSGDILVLGGLIKNSNLNGVSKVPILGDIPIIGNLFKYKNKDAEKKVLLVFIKPQILSTRGDNRKASMKDYNEMRNVQIRRNAGENLINDDDKGPILSRVGPQKFAALPAPFSNVKKS